tara:strand:- start:25 stop:213 length:189 start_codon:yes stop_codon:yes gene_type:complete
VGITVGVGVLSGSAVGVDVGGTFVGTSVAVGATVGTGEGVGVLVGTGVDAGTLGNTNKKSDL